MALMGERRADIQSLIEEGRSARDYAESLGDGEFTEILGDGRSVMGCFFSRTLTPVVQAR